MAKRKAAQRDSDSESENDYSRHRSNGQIDSTADEEFEFAGAMKSLQLENFMCHENLYIKFYPKINFIVGNNGSGKSAILTGIIVCLGAKASSTDRAKSLRFLVKEGKSSATVTLELWNRGSDAYKPEIYGSYITIQRKINGEGSGGGFKIIAENGKTISIRKEELTAICDHMKIQPDNPISILSQETAKKFIGTTNPHEKYQMFLKATHLSQLADDLSCIESTCTTANDIVEQKKKVLPEIKQALSEAQKRYKQLEEANNQHGRIQSLKNEMAWAQVVEVEREEEEARNQLESSKDRIHQLEDFIAKTTAECERAARQVTELEQRRSASIGNEAELKTKLQKIKNNRQSAMSEKEDINRTAARLNKDFEAKQARIQELTTQIQQEIRKSQQSSSSKQDHAKHRIAGLEEEIAGLERLIAERDHFLKQADEAMANLAAQTQEVDGEKRQVAEKIDSTRRQLQDLERSRHNRMAAYGPSMENVLRDINNEARWRDKPLGPLGLYIELTDPQWSNVIEQLLDNALTSFIVSSHEDRLTLNGILKRNQCHSVIYVSRLDNFDYSGGEPDERFLTILRCLAFKNEMVKRQLIVANKIEKIALVDHAREGDDIMNRGAKNIIGCYTKEGFQVGLRGGYGTFSMARFSKAPKLSGFNAENVRALKQEERYFTNELAAKNDQLNKIREETNRTSSSKRTHLEELHKARREVRFKRQQIGDIQQELKDNEPANIGAMEEMKREQEESLEVIRGQFDSVSDSLLAATRKVTDLDDQLRDLVAQIRTLSESAASFQDDIDKAEEIKNKSKSSEEFYKKKLDASKQNARGLESSLAAVAQRLQDIKEKARAYCPERVPVTKAPEALAREIQRAERVLVQAQECMGMSLDECLQDLNTKAVAYKAARDEIRKTEAFLRDLNAAWEIRKLRWNEFRKYMVKRTRYSFMYNLSARNFSGKLEFNHADQTLTPIVNASGQEQTAGKNRDPKSLSGGEKSFSTICLLLALWESMECPIRCLDEYDVFMDQANRKVSTNMIIGSARSSSKIQYILITPQGMDKDSVQPDVHVHRLGDPRANARS